MRIRTVVTALILILSFFAPGGVVQLKAGQTAANGRSLATQSDAIEVEVHVVDAQGMPVRDLRQGDFVLTEDGAQQKIAAFTRVSIRDEAAGAGSDVATNVNQLHARLYTLLLDDLQIARQNRDTAIQLAETFVEHYLGPNDQLEIISTSGSPDLRANFTSNRQLLLSVLQRFEGRRPESFRDSELFLATRVALRNLEVVANHLGSISGTGKRLLVVSQGIGYDYESEPTDEGASTIGAQLHAAIGAATRGNVTIYTLDASGFTDDDSPMGDSAQDSLRAMASATGGVSFLAPIDTDEAFERIVQRSSDYYLLGYHPAKTRAEGKHRNLAIKVNRPGVKVIARPGYTERDRRGTERTDLIPTIEDTSARVLEAVNSPLPRTGMTLSAMAAPIRGDDGKPQVAVLIESPDVSLVDSGSKFTGSIELLVVAVDRNGKVATGQTGRMSFGTTPENAARQDGRGLRTMVMLKDLEPGPYQLRIGTVDGNTGLQASVWNAIEVADFSAPPKGLAVSGMLLASKDETPRVLNGWMELVAELPVPPTTVREFRAGDELTVFAEVYDTAEESAQPLSISTRLVDADGNVVSHVDDTPSRDELNATKGMFRVKKPILLDGVAPGRYLVQVEAVRSAEDTDARAEVIRSVPITVLP